MAEERQRSDAFATATVAAEIRNTMRSKRNKRIWTANDFLPDRWKAKRQKTTHTMEQCGMAIVGTPPPWMNQGKAENEIKSEDV